MVYVCCLFTLIGRVVDIVVVLCVKIMLIIQIRNVYKITIIIIIIIIIILPPTSTVLNVSYSFNIP